MRHRFGIPAAALLLAFAGAALFGAPAVADQDEPPAAATVKAKGNVVTGGLGFEPAQVSVKVGERVRWTNTDQVVPHDATEVNGHQGRPLWQLTGDYGATPANPPGFGPGESRDRVFAAGGWSYYCSVHPEQMIGEVNVPATLLTETVRARAKKKGKNGKRRILKKTRVFVIWASGALPAGQVTEVQRRSSGGDWTTIRAGTRDTQGRFAGGRTGTNWGFRVRVKLADKPGIASGYSPEAKVTIP